MAATTTLGGFGTIADLLSTTTANTYSYLNGVLPQLMVFAVIIGILFMAIVWVKGIVSGHGNRV